jgi:hypothetical protein
VDGGVDEEGGVVEGRRARLLLFVIYSLYFYPLSINFYRF